MSSLANVNLGSETTRLAIDLARIRHLAPPALTLPSTLRPKNQFEIELVLSINHQARRSFRYFFCRLSRVLLQGCFHWTAAAPFCRLLPVPLGFALPQPGRRVFLFSRLFVSTSSSRPLPSAATTRQHELSSACRPCDTDSQHLEPLAGESLPLSPKGAASAFTFASLCLTVPGIAAWRWILGRTLSEKHLPPPPAVFPSSFELISLRGPAAPNWALKLIAGTLHALVLTYFLMESRRTC